MMTSADVAEFLILAHQSILFANRRDDDNRTRITKEMKTQLHPNISQILFPLTFLCAICYGIEVFLDETDCDMLEHFIVYLEVE